MIKARKEIYIVPIELDGALIGEIRKEAENVWRYWPKGVKKVQQAGASFSTYTDCFNSLL
jgi:hypothetical protein